MDDLQSNLAGLTLADIARLAEARRLPPVEKWDPQHCGHSGMRIARDGTWFHEGRPIGRPEMVRLFSTILRREPDGSFVLVTPVEKLAIDVDDAPFLAVEVKSAGESRSRSLAFRLNSGDLVVAGPDHPIILRSGKDGPHPYLAVRGGLEAMLARPVYYELAEIALAEASQPAGIWSSGAFFALEPGE
ncbi:DUF1285 domain-containing protein [Sphingosinicella terrae]|uniref:DUF1285 domain-containing protein n=1 Tax=Sphingosinicella terrae TaxID=2172047 RepID=UPI000E0DC5AA|nr:DUF1285 domain-containing protein [Sphingosinicella terrae]